MSRLVEDRVFLGGAVPDGVGRPYILATFTGGGQLETSDGPADFAGDLVEIASVADGYEEAAGLHAAAHAALLAEDEAGVIAIEATGRPYDAPNLDESKTLFAVVRVYRVDHREGV